MKQGKTLQELAMEIAAMPTLAEIPQLSLESCNITESRLYIKAVTPRIEGELSPGDVVNAGGVLSSALKRRGG